jgi:hypothetical protein
MCRLRRLSELDARQGGPSASYCVLVLAKGTFPAEMETRPDEVLDELPAAGSKYREIDEIRPAYIDDSVPEVPGMPFELPPLLRRKAPRQLPRLSADGAQSF